MSQKINKVFNFLSSKAKDLLHDYALRQLIDQAFSTKASIRVLARARLKKDYPDVWKEIENEQ
jgi:hypothetical protein